MKLSSAFACALLFFVSCIDDSLDPLDRSLGRIGTILDEAQRGVNQWSPEKVKEIATELTRSNAVELGKQLQVITESALIFTEAKIKGAGDWALDTTKMHLKVWAEKVAELRPRMKYADTAEKVRAILQELGNVEVVLPFQITGLAPDPLRLVWEGDTLHSWNEGDVRTQPITLTIGGNGLRDASGRKHGLIVKLDDEVVPAQFEAASRYVGKLRIPVDRLKFDHTRIEIRSATNPSQVSSMVVTSGRLETTKSENFERFTPEKWTQILDTRQHKGADNDFKGHGPRFTLEVSPAKVERNNNAWTVYIEVKAFAKETEHDGTGFTFVGRKNLKDFGYPVEVVGPVDGFKPKPHVDTGHGAAQLGGTGVIQHASYIGDTDGDDFGKTSFTLSFAQITVKRLSVPSSSGR